MNSIIITATINSTPAVSYTDTGLAIANCKLAIGDMKHLKLTAFGKLAESLKLKVGTHVLITGRLQEDMTLVADSIQPIPESVKLNRITLVGRTGKDTTIRYFESGKSVAETSLAVNRNKETTDWFKVTFWDKEAEVAYNYCPKGKQIGVTGRLNVDVWNDKQTGELRVKPVVVVERLELLGGKPATTASVENSNDEYVRF